MERLICIDFGSSFTKVAVRKQWGTKQIKLLELGRHADFKFVVPTLVARTSKTNPMVFGDDAADTVASPGVEIIQNWKKDIFSVDDSRFDGTLSIAVEFFSWLASQIFSTNDDYRSYRVRVCVPCLEGIAPAAVERRFRSILELSGFQPAESELCIFEPVANVWGFATGGQNKSWTPPHSGSSYVCPHYGEMFTESFGGADLFGLRHFVRSGVDSDCRRHFGVIDLGTFTLDFALVTFQIVDRDIEQFDKPIAKAASKRLGLGDLFQGILDKLEPSKQEAIGGLSFTDVDELRRRLFGGDPAQFLNGDGETVTIGENDEMLLIEEALRTATDRVWTEFRSFCSEHRVRPDLVVFTGGGSFIDSIRSGIGDHVRSHFGERAFLDINNREFWANKVRPEKRFGRMITNQQTVDRVILTSRTLSRGGSAVGGCSVIVDLPRNEKEQP